MSDVRFPFGEWAQWGSFKIPFIGVMVLTLLLLVGSLTNIDNAHFVQKVVIWVLGAAVISYGHSLAYSTQKFWQGEAFKDLRPRAQILAVVIHAIWFGAFILLVYWPALLKLP